MLFLTQRRQMFVLVCALAFTGCTAAIGDMDRDREVAGNIPGETLQPEEELDPLLCETDGEAGSQCQVAADCQAPMVCLDGACVGPRNPEHACSLIDGDTCGEGEVCVANVCVQRPGSCEVHDDCPLGYVCDNAGQCQPERDGTSCSEPGPGPDMSGTYDTVSVLHLREGIPGVVDAVLDVSEEVRDIVNGDIDLDLPGIVEDVLGALLSSIIRSYVPNWGINLVTALGDMSDMLDTMTIEGTMEIRGQPCEGVYRVKETWNWVRFEWRGQTLRFRPDNLPGVPGGTELVPDEYSALHACGVLYMDRHRIEDTMSGLIRFLLDTVTEAATGYPNPELALQDLGGYVCSYLGQEIDYQVSGLCSFCPSVGSGVNAVCNGYVNQAIVEVSQAIDDATAKLGLIKVKGTVSISGGQALQDGRWYGSILGGDFPGEFTMTPR